VKTMKYFLKKFAERPTWSKQKRVFHFRNCPFYCKKNRRRNVTLDSNILIAYIVSKRENTVIKKVIAKSVNYDKLMLTNIIFEECLDFASKRNANISEEEISVKLKKICPIIIDISPIPSDTDLLKKFKIRDIDDLKILYSVEVTNSEILVTMDEDFSEVEGIKAKIMKPTEYLYEGENNDKTSNPKEEP